MLRHARPHRPPGVRRGRQLRRVHSRARPGRHRAVPRPRSASTSSSARPRRIRRRIRRLPIVESTPLRNPMWPYSQAKIACEDLVGRAYREDGFPGHHRAAVAHLRPHAGALRHRLDRDRAHAAAASRSWSTGTAPRSGRSPTPTTSPRASSRCSANAQAIGDSVPHHVGRSARPGTRSTRCSPPPQAPSRHGSCTCPPTRSSARRGLGPQPSSATRPTPDLRQRQDPRLAPGYVATIPFSQGAREIIAWHDAEPTPPPGRSPYRPSDRDARRPIRVSPRLNEKSPVSGAFLRWAILGSNQ